MASGYMFGQYFLGDGIVNEAPANPVSTYPQWQSSVVMGMGLIPLHALPPDFWKKVKLFFKLIPLIFSPDFERASKIVYDVAHTPDMNNGKAWGVIGNYMGKQPGVGENVYRHLLAAQKWGPEPHEKRHQRDLILQLAYVMYKKERS